MTDPRVFGLDLDLGLVPDEDGWVVATPSTRGGLRAVARAGVRPSAQDLGVVDGWHALVQAIVLRLMTERGELTDLGYPDYGSRHHALVGEPNTEGNRALLKLYVLECLRQEPRIERVLAIDVRPEPGRERRADVRVTLSVRAAGVAPPIELVVPFTFAGGVP